MVNNDDLTLRKQSNFTVLFKHGVGILVFEFKGSLQVTLSSLPVQMVRVEIKNYIKHKSKVLTSYIFDFETNLFFAGNVGRIAKSGPV